MAKITKKEFLKMAEKIRANKATPKEKLKLLKDLNSFIEKTNVMVEDLVGMMRKEASK